MFVSPVRSIRRTYGSHVVHPVQQPVLFTRPSKSSEFDSAIRRRSAKVSSQHTQRSTAIGEIHAPLPSVIESATWRRAGESIASHRLLNPSSNLAAKPDDSRPDFLSSATGSSCNRDGRCNHVTALVRRFLRARVRERLTSRHCATTQKRAAHRRPWPAYPNECVRREATSETSSLGRLERRARRNVAISPVRRPARSGAGATSRSRRSSARGSTPPGSANQADASPIASS